MHHRMPPSKTGCPSLNVVIFSTCDAPRPGRPKTVATPEIIDRIWNTPFGYQSQRSKKTASHSQIVIGNYLNHCDLKFSSNFVGLVTRLQARRPRNWGSIPESGKRRVVVPKRPEGALKSSLSTIQQAAMTPYLGEKLPGREGDRLHLLPRLTFRNLASHI